MEVRDAPLGHDVVHVAARGDDAGALGQGRNDARELVVVARRAEDDDGLAVLRAGRAPDEVDLPADAGEENR